MNGWNVARAGWRPALSWVVVLAVGVQFLIRPFFHSVGQLDVSELLALIGSAGGLAFLRSKDKKDGTAEPAGK